MFFLIWLICVFPVAILFVILETNNILLGALSKTIIASVATAIAILIYRKRKKNQKKQNKLSVSSEDENISLDKECPFCFSKISRQDDKCPCCGYIFKLDKSITEANVISRTNIERQENKTEKKSFDVRPIPYAQTKKLNNSHPFNFMGGEELSHMGATWFVSYAYNQNIDSNHQDWMKVKTASSRASIYRRTEQYHEFWLKQILKMNDSNLNKNSLKLNAQTTKNMARILLEKIYT